MFCGPTRPYTTLVYEPDLPPLDQTTFDEWQLWNVTAGKFWSTRNIGILADVFGGSGDMGDLRTLDQIKQLCPLGVVISIGVGQGARPQKAEAAADELRFAAKQIDVTHPDERQCPGRWSDPGRGADAVRRLVRSPGRPPEQPAAV